MRSRLPPHLSIRVKATLHSTRSLIVPVAKESTDGISNIRKGYSVVGSSRLYETSSPRTRIQRGEQPSLVDVWAASTRSIPKRFFHTTISSNAQALPNRTHDLDEEVYEVNEASDPYPYDLFDRPGPSEASSSTLSQFRQLEIENPDLISEEYDNFPIPDASSSSAEAFLPIQDYEEPLEAPIQSSTRRKRRDKQLKTLPVGPSLNADSSRFDWRTRAPSRMRHTRGYRWFPSSWHVNRQKPPQTKLEPDEAYFDEVERYNAQGNIFESEILTNSFRPLLEAEFAEEQRLHEQRQADWTEERLIREGYMMKDLTGVLYPVKRKDTGFVYNFSKKGSEAMRVLPFHHFVVGTMVELCRTHPLEDFICLDGLPLSASESKKKMIGKVYSVGRGYISVAFEHEVIDITDGSWRIDIGCSDFALKRQLSAIQSLNLDPHIQESSDLDDSRKSSTNLNAAYMSDEDLALSEDSPRPRRKSQTKLEGTNLRDLLLEKFHEDGEGLDDPHAIIPETKDLAPGTMDATPNPLPLVAEMQRTTRSPISILGRNQLIQSWTKRYYTPEGKSPLIVEGDPEISLTETQLRAMAMMLSERLSLVQGPPGTGKTRVIAELVRLLKLHFQVPEPILATAHTNAAVDNLVAGFKQQGLKVLRYGPVERVREDLQDYTFDKLFESHPSFSKYEQIKQRKEDNFKRSKDATGEEKLSLAKQRGKDSWQLSRLKSEITREILLDADVICTTCISSVAWPLGEIDFPIVFLDEASMATEPLSLIPLTKGSSHVVIIGDHKQLPPVIISPEAQAGGLATSLFERLIHEHNVPSIMLDTQYRMHPSIAQFPSQAFYQSRLQNGTAHPDGNAFPRLDPPETSFLKCDHNGSRMNMTFVDHNHHESPMFRSVANYGDAEKVVDVIADLLHCNPTLQGKDIGVITPYSAQIRLLEDYVRAEPKRQAAFLDLLGTERVKELEEIEIRTVDGFEGREKDVIIFSTVRSNDAGYIGFLGDWRRLNVGITRAKRALITIGSRSTLLNARTGNYAKENLPSGGPKIWRDFIDHLDKHDMILKA